MKKFSLCSASLVAGAILLNNPVLASASTRVLTAEQMTAVVEIMNAKPGLRAYLTHELRKSYELDLKRLEPNVTPVAHIDDLKIIGYDHWQNHEQFLITCKLNNQPKLASGYITNRDKSPSGHVGFWMDKVLEQKNLLLNASWRGSSRGIPPTAFDGFVNDSEITTVRITVGMEDTLEVPVLEHRYFIGIMDSAAFRKPVGFEGLDKNRSVIHSQGAVVPKTSVKT